MKILFTFENLLPNPEADAEVFIATANHLAPHAERAWLHVPAPDPAAAQAAAGIELVSALAPQGPAALRHFFAGLTIRRHRQFREADLVYTRNLWVAWNAILAGQKVVFDHYRPWPDQIPPLQLWIHGLFCHPRFLAAICHSDYTQRKYLELGVPPAKLFCVHNGFEPERFASPLAREDARRALGLDEARKIAVYTGRINRKKGLELVLRAAKMLPEILFLLVGSYGEGPIEAEAKTIANIRIVPFQPPEALAPYIYAADLLLIPPSRQPLAAFGSTVLPLKLFLYLASDRAILAGDTPDVREVLRHDENSWLCRTDDVAALADALRRLTSDASLTARLAARAKEDSRNFTWQARAGKIAAIIEDRLAAAPLVGGAAGPSLAAWLGRSRRWLMHYLRSGSFILPPDPSAAD